MTIKQKTDEINRIIDDLNENFLHNFKAKIAFVVKGKGKYALTLVFRKREVKCQTFLTYDDVLAALNFYEDIIDRANHEKGYK